MKILGHRGDGVSNKTPELRALRKKQGKLPENTLAGFKKVLAEGADGIEFDVVMSADGKAMVIHDDELSKHVEGASGLVSKTSCADLQKLNVGEGSKIPTLEEVIEASGKEKFLNVELKGEGSALPIARVINQYARKGWNKANFVVSSFKWDLLKEVRKADMSLQVGVIFEPGEKIADIGKIVKEYSPYSLHPDFRDVTEAVLEDAKKHGLVVIAWMGGENIEDHKSNAVATKLANFIKKGYNLHIITDHPKLLREQVATLCKKD